MNPSRDGKQNGHDQGGYRQLQRVRITLSEQFGDALAIADGHAKIAVQDPFPVIEILPAQRKIEAVGMAGRPANRPWARLRRASGRSDHQERYGSARRRGRPPAIGPGGCRGRGLEGNGSKNGRSRVSGLFGLSAVVRLALVFHNPRLAIGAHRETGLRTIRLECIDQIRSHPVGWCRSYALDVYLVDGTYELFRHYYALPSARDAGRPGGRRGPRRARFGAGHDQRRRHARRASRPIT